MPARANAERRDEHRALKAEVLEERPYTAREKELAARIASKERRQFGESQRREDQGQGGQRSTRDLPLEGYRHLPVATIKRRLHNLSHNQIKELRKYEKAHKARKTMIAVFDKALKDE